jgi:hypothetical protein
MALKTLKLPLQVSKVTDNTVVFKDRKDEDNPFASHKMTGMYIPNHVFAALGVTQDELGTVNLTITFGK